MRLDFTGPLTIIAEPTSRIAQGYGAKVRADSLSVTNGDGDTKVIERAEGRDYAEKALTLTQRDALYSLSPEAITESLAQGFLTLPDARQGRKAAVGLDLAAFIAAKVTADAEAAAKVAAEGETSPTTPEKAPKKAGKGK